MSQFQRPNASRHLMLPAASASRHLMLPAASATRQPAGQSGVHHLGPRPHPRVGGEGCWHSLPKGIDLIRCGKSYSLGWISAAATARAHSPSPCVLCIVAHVFCMHDEALTLRLLHCECAINVESFHPCLILELRAYSIKSLLRTHVFCLHFYIVYCY
jgi:hypothetical protein